jgi:FkbM family methyltransferase
MFYSQNDEDKILLNIFDKKQNGKYIELGALDGQLHSNTLFFEKEYNWSGILIEPNPIEFKKLSLNRSNLNYLFNELISNTEEELDFYIDIDLPAVSGVKIDIPEKHKNVWFKHNETLKIKPKKLTDIIKQTNITYFDYMSLDCEGHELDVLESWDFSIPIYIIIIEMSNYNLEKENKIYEIMKHNNYKILFQHKSNIFFTL